MIILTLLIIWFILSMYKPTFEYIKESNILIMYYNKSEGGGITRKRIIFKI